MYIPAFWAGVAATILAEVGALLVYAVAYNARREKRRKRAQEHFDRQRNNRTEEF